MAMNVVGPVPMPDRRRGERRKDEVAARERLIREVRQEIARDLHDRVVQSLTASLMALQVLAEARKDEPGLAADLAVARDSAREGLIALRRIISESRSQPSAGGQLVDRLRRSMRRLFPPRAGVRTRLTVDPSWQEPDPATSVLVYGIAEEALVNARRHSRATVVDVHLAVRDGRAEVTVRDNGMGLDASSRRRLRAGERLGLVGMRERATILGADLSVVTAEPKGTVVRLALPGQRP